MINVWQTLDLIAGADLKLRIEGYQDVNSLLKAISKRDSFSRDVQTDQRRESNEDSTLFPGNSKQVISSSGKKSKNKSKVSAGGRGRKKYFRYGQKKTKPKTSEDDLPAEYEAVVDCSFNLPRISGRLERLMGTNVVRLTDRKYMKELRQRLQDDYILMLNKRIEARELKELERERNLILEGKTDKIPDALSNHPIFIVNKRVNNLITKRRAKLKTTREKNSEKLLRQGAKWERERLIYEELDKQKEEEIKEIKAEQKALEENFKRENETDGINLLRIHDRAYKECEMDLKDFLKKERKRMKAQSRKKSQQYTGDPLDIANIVRKRQKFRELERRIRQELDEKFKSAKAPEGKQILARAAATSEMSRQMADQDPLQDRASNEASQDSSESDLSLVAIPTTQNQLSQTESVYLARMRAAIEEDVVKGFLVSKVQFDELHYSDPRVVRLKLADNIRELYILAEEIITGEPLDQEEAEEEEQIDDDESDAETLS